MTLGLHAIDEGAALNLREVEPLPVRDGLSDHGSGVEEIVGDEPVDAERLVVGIAVIDDFGSGMERGHHVGGLWRRRTCFNGAADAHRNLTFNTHLAIIAVREFGFSLMQGRGEDFACGRAVDAEESPHHRRGTADLEARDRTEGILQHAVGALLPEIGLILAGGPARPGKIHGDGTTPVLRQILQP